LHYSEPYAILTSWFAVFTGNEGPLALYSAVINGISSVPQQKTGGVP
jgi:hypothetical protein